MNPRNDFAEFFPHMTRNPGPMPYQETLALAETLSLLLDFTTGLIKATAGAHQLLQRMTQTPELNFRRDCPMILIKVQLGRRFRVVANALPPCFMRVSARTQRWGVCGSINWEPWPTPRGAQRSASVRCIKGAPDASSSTCIPIPSRMFTRAPSSACQSRTRSTDTGTRAVARRRFSRTTSTCSAVRTGDRASSVLHLISYGDI